MRKKTSSENLVRKKRFIFCGTDLVPSPPSWGLDSMSKSRAGSKWKHPRFFLLMLIFDPLSFHTAPGMPLVLTLEF
jgi:hypothetical protein